MFLNCRKITLFNYCPFVAKLVTRFRVVVYFDWCLGGVHSKGWPTSLLQCFWHILQDFDVKIMKNGAKMSFV